MDYLVAITVRPLVDSEQGTETEAPVERIRVFTARDAKAALEMADEAISNATEYLTVDPAWTEFVP